MKVPANPPKQRRTMTVRQTPAVSGPHYEVRAADLHAHLWSVTLHLTAAPSAVVTVSLPVWIAGSYMVREFSKHLGHLEARQGAKGKLLALTQVNKNTWEVACTPGKPVALSMSVFAHDNSVRSAWLDADRGFFNPTSLCLRVHGLDHLPHTIEIQPTPATAKWQVITGLEAFGKPRSKLGFHTYTATTYQELADSPFEMGLSTDAGGQLWIGEFTARGTPHQFVVSGALKTFDGDRLLADTQRICEAAIDFWHGTGKKNERPARKGSAPMRRYVFMLNAVAEGYGGLEHHNSTALIAKRADLPQQASSGLGLGAMPNGEGYTRLLGLISHEYFHTWNVKRLRPAEFEHYTFDAEQYTQLLWFFEGFTSYYDDLLLRRAGLINIEQYLHLLEKTIQGVLAQPGRLQQSVAQASFDAWVKYYRPDSNSPNANVSYYTKGSLVALCFDLTLRQDGESSLDRVMREVWAATHGGPMTEAQFCLALEKISGRSFSEEVAKWVHDTAELPLADLLDRHGIRMAPQRQSNSAGMASSLGLVVSEGQVIQIKSVLHRTPAHAAGFSAGDEWWAIEQASTKTRRTQTWRVTNLQQLRQLTEPGEQLLAVVARDQRVLKLPLKMPSKAEEAQVQRLSLVDFKACAAWLGTQP